MTFVVADFMGQHRSNFINRMLAYEGVKKNDFLEPTQTGKEGVAFPAPFACVHYIDTGEGELGILGKFFYGGP